MNASTRVASLVTALLIVLGCSTVAIVATYPRLSHTWDEATHVVAGLEVLQDQTYTFQTENPPLSRVPLAIIPFLNGARLPSAAQRAQGAIFAANTIYYRSPDYIRHVTEGRLANLFFFWCCVALTWTMAGGRSTHGSPSSLVRWWPPYPRSLRMPALPPRTFRSS